MESLILNKTVFACHMSYSSSSDSMYGQHLNCDNYKALQWPAFQFSKSRMLLCLGQCMGIDLEKTFVLKRLLHLRQNWRNVKMQKILEPRGERPILTERIGKGFSEKNTMKLDFEY